MINLTSIRTPLQVRGIRDKWDVPFAQAVDWADFWRQRRAGELDIFRRCAGGKFGLVRDLRSPRVKSSCVSETTENYGYMEFHNPNDPIVKAWWDEQGRKWVNDARERLGLPKKTVDRSENFK